MAVETPLFPITLESTGDYTGNQFLAMVATAGKATLAGAGVKILGVLQNKPDTGQAALIECYGVTKGISGAAITAGVELEVNASGKFITLAAGISVGYALTAAAGADDVFTLVLK